VSLRSIKTEEQAPEQRPMLNISFLPPSAGACFMIHGAGLDVQGKEILLTTSISLKKALRL
jgi:hypothetical protein